MAICLPYSQKLAASRDPQNRAKDKSIGLPYSKKSAAS